MRQAEAGRKFVHMRESHRFDLPDGNEVTISQVDQGEYAEDKILITLEEAEKDSMSLLVRKKEARGIGRALMYLGFEPSCAEEE